MHPVGTRRSLSLLLFIAIFQTLITTSAAAKAIQSTASIRDAARQFLVAELGDAGDDVKIKVGRLDPRLRLARCDRAVEVYPSPGGRLAGHTTVGVRCDGSTPWSLFVPVHIERYVDVVVATRHIARGELITPQVVRIDRRSSERLRNNDARRLQDVVGFVAARALPRGSTFSAHAVKARRLVKRGDRVVLSIQAGAVAVRAAGEALSDGARGDRIRVRNLSSKRVLDGVVHGTNLVVVGGGIDPGTAPQIARKY